MTVTFNAQNTPIEGNAVTSFSNTSLTIGAGSNIELVVILTFNNNVSGISGTWNASQSCVLVGGPTTSTNCGFTYIYHVTAPATGNHALAFNWTGSSDYYLVALAFNGAPGGVGNYVSASGSSTTASVASVNGTTDAIVTTYQNIHTTSPGTITNGTAVTNAGLGTFSINANAAYAVSGGALIGSNQTISCAVSPTDNWVAVGVTVLATAAASGGTTTYHWNLGVNI